MDERIREAVDISAFSYGDIDEYKNFTDKEILTPQQNRIIKQSKFIYFPLWEESEKQMKTIVKQGEKQIRDSKSLDFPNKMNELKQIDDIFPGKQLNNLM